MRALTSAASASTQIASKAKKPMNFLINICLSNWKLYITAARYVDRPETQPGAVLAKRRS